MNRKKLETTNKIFCQTTNQLASQPITAALVTGQTQSSYCTVHEYSVQKCKHSVTYKQPLTKGHSSCLSWTLTEGCPVHITSPHYTTQGHRPHMPNEGPNLLTHVDNAGFSVRSSGENSSGCLENENLICTWCDRPVSHSYRGSQHGGEGGEAIQRAEKQPGASQLCLHRAAREDALTKITSRRRLPPRRLEGWIILHEARPSCHVTTHIHTLCWNIDPHSPALAGSLFLPACSLAQPSSQTKSQRQRPRRWEEPALLCCVHTLRRGFGL